MRKRFIDPQICGDCEEEDCLGCELVRSDEDAETNDTEGNV